MLSKKHSGSGRVTRAISRRRQLGLLVVILCAALAWPAYDALAAQPPVALGTAGNFAVLAGSAVTNTGPSTLNGELGVSPGTSITGFPPGTATAATHSADAVAGQAQTDLTTAYNNAAGRTPALTVAGDLGGSTLTPGVYKSASSLGLTGQLTLNAEGNPDAVFIFKAGSTLTTASASHVILTNGAQACNVYWQVGSSATLGSASVFAGSILANTSISLDNGVTVHGSALARNGAVTLINDTVTPSACAAAPGTTPSGTTPAGSTPTSKTHNGTALLKTIPGSVGIKVARHGTSECVRGPFKVAVTGLRIRRVVFSAAGKVIASKGKAPYVATVAALGRTEVITARVTYTDGTHAATLRFRFRACAAAALKTMHPAQPIVPVGFTG